MKITSNISITGRYDQTRNFPKRFIVFSSCRLIDQIVFFRFFIQSLASLCDNSPHAVECCVCQLALGNWVKRRGRFSALEQKFVDDLLDLWALLYLPLVAQDHLQM